ncbi:uncharacterized protein I206_105677 [Kwoniella pini CBS 10737]|uniref:Uncharacterized protein n=1 Tax=Kwoniella pini CBS 10737 TaxID=1296096 RepID=A0A1B9I3J1_9TREE|nr:uncharacterized protein I206_03421 [Kwoniella pini CBS 10737]OCF50104.1 hypothetical protein I206_03421 [Kwoniella pini CBS 10737]
MTYPFSNSDEIHLLYVLLDSNLPTGGFVSSSGLESFSKHGFLSNNSPSYNNDNNYKRNITEGIIEFSKSEIENYSNTTCEFVSKAWKIINNALSIIEFLENKNENNDNDNDNENIINKVIKKIIKLDEYNEITLLSHVNKRSSKAQGVAMLTLFSRGLSEPFLNLNNNDDEENENQNENENRNENENYQIKLKKEKEKKEKITKMIIEEYKKQIRKNRSPGHLSICWGVITACLGLSLNRSIHLHLFLHSRSLLSSAVRLNLIGPYASSQLLLYPFKKIINDQVELFFLKEKNENQKSKNFENSFDSIFSEINYNLIDDEEEEESFWKWSLKSENFGPSTTWPLGEILSSRHDLQHSRIFNS